jgi:hypothetical protein
MALKEQVQRVIQSPLCQFDCCVALQMMLLVTVPCTATFTKSFLVPAPS